MHFSAFTSEAMQSLAQEMSAGLQRRRDFLADTKNHVVNLLQTSRRDLQEVESQRCSRAREAAEARRTSIDTLRAEMQAFRDRCASERDKVLSDLQTMADEYRAASQAWKQRHI